MRTLAILFTLFYFLSALAVAPLGFKGQNQSTTYPSVVQVPGQLMTKTSGSESLIETGNKNILLNPSFEAPLVSFAAPSWSSLGFLTSNTTPPVSGLKAVQVSMTASALSLHQDSGLNNAAYGDGLQCLASVYVRTSLSGIFVSPRLNNVTSTSNMVSVVPNGKWALYKVPFICSTGANGIAIHSNGVAVTGSVDVDDAFVAAVDLQASTNNISNWVTGTCTSTWTTNTSVACKHRQVGTNLEIQYFLTLSGAPNATGFYFNLPSGFTMDTTKIMSTTTNAASFGSGSARRASTGAYYGLSVNIASSTLLGAYYLVNNTIPPTSTSASDQLAEISATVPHTWASGDTISVTASVPVTQFSSTGSVYTSTNGNTNTVAYTPTVTTASGAMTNYTATGNWYRDGEYLFGQATITFTGAPGTWSGPFITIPSGYTIDTSKLLSVNRGTVEVRGTSNNFAGYLTYVATTTTIGSSAVAVTTHTGTAPVIEGAIAQNFPTTFASGNSIQFTYKVPIVGWENSNIIIGQFNGLQSCTSTLACTDTFSAKISAAGVVTDENVDWINGPATVATSTFTIPFNTSIFTVTPNCAFVSSANNSLIHVVLVSSSSSNAVVYSARTDTGAPLAGSFQIICQKQGADYVGNTALAVASDQNVRSIGSTGVDIQSVYFGSSADCSTACTTGTCTICNQVGSKITSVTWSSLGSYLLNGIDGKKYNCSGTGYTTTNIPIIHQKPVSTTTYALIQNNPNANSSYNSVLCMGIP